MYYSNRQFERMTILIWILSVQFVWHECGLYRYVVRIDALHNLVVGCRIKWFTALVMDSATDREQSTRKQYYYVKHECCFSWSNLFDPWCFTNRLKQLFDPWCFTNRLNLAHWVNDGGGSNFCKQVWRSECNNCMEEHNCSSCRKHSVL